MSMWRRKQHPADPPVTVSEVVADQLVTVEVVDMVAELGRALEASQREITGLIAENVRLRQLIVAPVPAAPVTMPHGDRPCSRCGQPMPFGYAHYCPDAHPRDSRDVA